jgi:hypothetical protein
MATASGIPISSLLERDSLFALGSAVSFEKPRRGELSQLVADHIFRDVNGKKLPAIMDGQGVSDHLRHNHGSTRPGFKNFLLPAAIHLLDSAEQAGVNKGALGY